MSLKIAARFARRELRGGLRGFRIFLACLTLGVAAIVGSGAVRDSGGAPPVADDTPASEAPTFAPDAPGDSARELADWIRTRDG